MSSKKENLYYVTINGKKFVSISPAGRVMLTHSANHAKKYNEYMAEVIVAGLTVRYRVEKRDTNPLIEIPTIRMLKFFK